MVEEKIEQLAYGMRNLRSHTRARFMDWSFEKLESVFGNGLPQFGGTIFDLRQDSLRGGRSRVHKAEDAGRDEIK